MIMQKKGFLLFLCSLIPGAGELYMGFKKRGVSMMAIFWGIVALACVSGLEWFALALPVVWAYSFCRKKCSTCKKMNMHFTLAMSWNTNERC